MDWVTFTLTNAVQRLDALDREDMAVEVRLEVLTVRNMLKEIVDATFNSEG